MRKSELRLLIRETLDEIGFPKQPKSTGLMAHLAKLLKRAEENPQRNDIAVAHETVQKILSSIKVDIKNTISSVINNNEQEYKNNAKSFDYYLTSLGQFLSDWGDQIVNKNPNIIDQMNRTHEEVTNHILQIHKQNTVILRSIHNPTETGQKNYINAQKEINHLNEIIESLRKSIDELFQIGLNVGYGQKKK